MSVLKSLDLNSMYDGIVQPADDYYNNTDTFYWEKNPDLFDDGGKEFRAGASQNRDANVKFKFLMY